MLTAELVRLHKDGDALTVKPLAAKARPRALEYAAFLVETAAGLLGEPREEVEAALAAFDLRPAEARLGAGLRRLVLDRCAFASDDRLDAPGLRAEVFLAATAARRGLAEEARFDRGAVLAAVAAARGEAPEAIDGALFGDLKQAQVLNDFAAISPESLLEVYDLAQAQAVLLRAYGVEAEVEGGTPADYRHLFRTLKFRRLLYRLAPLPGEGYRVILEGPHALFNASTRYGLQLALVLPALRVFPRWRLAADVAWGPTRARQRFRIAGEGRPAPEPEDTADLPEEAARLVERWDALGSAWRVGPASKLVDLPGVGLAVTDLVFTHRETGRQVYLEMLGFWSREAVWRRVDLAQAGAGVPIVFAVSERLRVSEQVLDDQVPAALYVYKGALSPRAVLARVEEVASRCAS